MYSYLLATDWTADHELASAFIKLEFDMCCPKALVKTAYAKHHFVFLCINFLILDGSGLPGNHKAWINHGAYFPGCHI